VEDGKGRESRGSAARDGIVLSFNSVPVLRAGSCRSWTETRRKKPCSTPTNPKLGKNVSLDAEVLSKRFTYTGDHLLLEVNFDSEVLSVFIPNTAGAETLEELINEGDFISITGIISEYKGKKEIRVERKEDITTLK